MVFRCSILRKLWLESGKIFVSFVLLRWSSKIVSLKWIVTRVVSVHRSNWNQMNITSFLCRSRSMPGKRKISSYTMYDCERKISSSHRFRFRILCDDAASSEEVCDGITHGFPMHPACSWIGGKKCHRTNAIHRSQNKQSNLSDWFCRARTSEIRHSSRSRLSLELWLHH